MNKSIIFLFIILIIIVLLLRSVHHIDRATHLVGLNLFFLLQPYIPLLLYNILKSIFLLVFLGFNLSIEFFHQIMYQNIEQSVNCLLVVFLLSKRCYAHSTLELLNLIYEFPILNIDCVKLTFFVC